MQSADKRMHLLDAGKIAACLKYVQRPTMGTGGYDDQSFWSGEGEGEFVAEVIGSFALAVFAYGKEGIALWAWPLFDIAFDGSNAGRNPAAVFHKVQAVGMMCEHFRGCTDLLSFRVARSEESPVENGGGEVDRSLWVAGEKVQQSSAMVFVPMREKGNVNPLERMTCPFGISPESTV